MGGSNAADRWVHDENAPSVSGHTLVVAVEDGKRVEKVQHPDACGSDVLGCWVTQMMASVAGTQEPGEYALAYDDQEGALVFRRKETA